MAPDLRRLPALAAVLALVLAALAPPVLAQTAAGGGVQRTTDLQDPALRDLRQRMIAGRTLTDAQLRALADAGDGLAAFRYADRLDQAAEAEPARALLSRVHYYALATYTGRDFAASRLVAALDFVVAEAVALSPARAKAAEDALLVAARRGNAAAALALGRFYAAGVPFGPQPEKARDLLVAAAESGGPGASRAALNLALAAIGSRSRRPRRSRNRAVYAAAGRRGRRPVGPRHGRKPSAASARGRRRPAGFRALVRPRSDPMIRRLSPLLAATLAAAPAFAGSDPALPLAPETLGLRLRGL